MMSLFLNNRRRTESKRQAYLGKPVHFHIKTQGIVTRALKKCVLFCLPLENLIDEKMWQISSISILNILKISTHLQKHRFIIKMNAPCEINVCSATATAIAFFFSLIQRKKKSYFYERHIRS